MRKNSVIINSTGHDLGASFCKTRSDFHIEKTKKYEFFSINNKEFIYKISKINIPSITLT